MNPEYWFFGSIIVALLYVAVILPFRHSRAEKYVCGNRPEVMKNLADMESLALNPRVSGKTRYSFRKLKEKFLDSDKSRSDWIESRKRLKKLRQSLDQIASTMHTEIKTFKEDVRKLVGNQ